MPNRKRTSALLAASLTLAACATADSNAPEANNARESAPKVAEKNAAPKAAGTVELELAFITHLDANLPEQDVYIERQVGSGKIYRVTTGDHNMRAPLYKTARYVKHNPFDPKAVGPYKRGEPLGFTLGEWLKHAGNGSYTCDDGTGTLEIDFTGLVPNGVYTMWHAFMAMPPTDPFSGTLDLPLGARDGSDSVFKADARGRARFKRSFSPCLELSDQYTTSMLAINYHSDGKTYKADPGEFGIKSHIPLFVMLPKQSEANSVATTASR